MAEFHFLRPWWLAALPIGIALIWKLLRGRADGAGWGAVIDAGLRAHVLAAPQMLRESRWPLLAGLAVWVLTVTALAGPAWERLPVPAFRSDEALVVAFDLSRSMDAADLTPSRLARAKLKLLALLERRQAGQTALVVFSTHAFTVTPLTTDTRTIASLVTALNTDIMPSQGSSVETGLAKAGTLLRQTGLSEGEILLISDADVTPADLKVARDLRGDDFVVHVLAVGTAQGAPIAEAQGGFLTDANGLVVVPQLDPAGLRSLATAGGGRFAQLSADERDLDALFPPRATLAAGATLASEAAEQYEADVWRDQGLWLVLGLLPLLALGFRRGWVAILVAWLVLPTPRAEAFEWQDLWLRPDQRGLQALEAEQAQRAAELFENPEWRGAAQYRAGDFVNSAQSLNGIATAEGHYNRGNALAKAGQIEQAIEAYDEALALNPEHQDALYNRELLAKYLEDNPQQQQQQQNQDQGDEQGDEQKDQQQGDSESSEGSGEQANEDQSEQGESKDAQGQQSQADGQGSQDDPSQKPNDEEGQDAESEQAAQERSEQEPGESDAEQAPGPEDVEQWASEQAAEQWLRRIPQDPGGLLRRKFLYQYQRLGVDQDGNPVWPGDAAKPW